MVLFDCDGVLVDSEPLTEGVICADLARYGLALTPAQFSHHFLGGTMMGVAARARELGADLPDTWVDDVYAKMFEVLKAQVTAIDGIDYVLDALDLARIPFAVGSNGPHRKMEITLGRTGLTHRFAGRIYSREDVLRPKPAPDVYLKAANDAGIPPERCVVIEDSSNGAKAGQAAGMTVFGFAADTDRARLAPFCDHIFDHMHQLPALLSLPHAR